MSSTANSNSNPTLQSRRGMALMVVLGAVSLILILTLGMFYQATVEQRQAVERKTQLDTRQLAKQAEEIVRAQITEAVGSVFHANLSTRGAWASQPGMIRTFNNDGSPRAAHKLYSWPDLVTTGGFALAGDQSVPGDWAAQGGRFVDLNHPYRTLLDDGSTSDPVYPILYPPDMVDVDGFSVTNAPGAGAGNANPVPMPVQWMYKLQDGSWAWPESVSEGVVRLPGASANNPPVGRIAFWTDDETAKVNLNTAAGGKMWTEPRYRTTQEDNSRLIQPVEWEFQRYPGHPARTDLTAVFPMLHRGMGRGDDWDEIYRIVPRTTFTTTGSSRNGLGLAPGEPDAHLIKESANVIRAQPIDPPANERLFATLGEALFMPNPDGGQRQTYDEIPEIAAALGDSTWRETLERRKFFLTTTSRAPELTLFNTPKVSMWPIHSNSGNQRRSPQDRLIAFASTLSLDNVDDERVGHAYYFERASPYSIDADVNLERNQTLLRYLQDLSTATVPGFGDGGTSFASKYGNRNRDQILVQIFDYIRSTNLIPPGTLNFSNGKVVPTVTNLGNGEVRGFGRWFTVAELGLQFIVNADSTIPPSNGVEGPPESVFRSVYRNSLRHLGSPADDPSSQHYSPPAINDPSSPYYIADGTLPPRFKWGNRALGGTSLSFETEFIIDPESVVLNESEYYVDLEGEVVISKKEIVIQAFLQISLMTPSAGYKGIGAGRDPGGPAFVIRQMENLEALFPDGVTRNLGFPASVEIPEPFGPRGSHESVSGIRHLDPGGVLDAVWSFIGWGAGEQNVRPMPPFFPARDSYPVTAYPYIGLPLRIAYDPREDGDQTFTIQSTTIEVDLYARPNLTKSSENVIQTITVDIPQTTIELPLLVTPASNLRQNYNNFWNAYLDIAARLEEIRLKLANPSLSTEQRNNLEAQRDEFLEQRDDLYEVRNGDNSNLELDGNSQEADTRWWVFHRKGISSDAPPGRIALMGTYWIHALDTVQSFILEHGDSRLLFGPDTVENADKKRWVATPPPAAEFNSTGWQADHVPNRQRHYFWQHHRTSNWDGTYIANADGSSPFYVAVRNNNHKPIILNPSLYPHHFTAPWTHGDWDVPAHFGISEGPLINKPDEGSMFNNPYEEGVSYGSDDAHSPQHYHNPNRQMSSPVMFGSLPTGMISGEPWQTLLFRPEPGHPGAAAPHDHLLLDLFWMPVVEPYAISEPFSTAGKINMNYQIMPFNYIERTTGLHALLMNESLHAVRNNAALFQQNYSRQQNQIASGTRFLFDINPIQTLVGFEQRFGADASGVFLAPSEITQIHMVIRDHPQFRNPTYTQMPLVWNFSRATPDNLRERIYSHLYPRLTTRSNSFTIHYWVETLTSLPDRPADQWREGVDVVSGQERGSVAIERYLNPNDSNLVDMAVDTSFDLNQLYRFRTLQKSVFHER